MEDFQSSAPRRVEAYLDTVLASLPRRLSAFQVSELRRELRTHLWERVAAYEELGQTEDDAVTEALQQFGGSKDFVKQWRWEWRKPAMRITAREVWEATRPMLRPSLLGLALATAPFGLLFIPRLLGQFYTLPWAKIIQAEAMLFWPLMGVSYLVLPVLIGTSQGRRVPERAGLGMAAVLAAELTVTSLLYLVCPTELSSQPSADNFFSLLLGLLVFWLPLASGAAALTSWWTRRVRARRVA